MKRYEISTNSGHAVNMVYAADIRAARAIKFKIYGCHAWEFKVERDTGVLGNMPVPADYRDPEPISR